MTNNPEYAAQYQIRPRAPLSISALISLILGILLCIPLVTSLTAILLAIVGFRATRNQAASGRGLAIAGLVLGIIGTLAWICIGCFAAFIIVGSQAPRAVLHEFARDLTAGNTPAATALCDPSISSSDIDSLHSKIVSYGTYSDLTCTSVNLGASPTGEKCTLIGTASFSKGSHPFNAIVIKNAAGAWKIFGFHIY